MSTLMPDKTPLFHFKVPVLFFVFFSGLFVVGIFMVQLDSYNGFVVETVTKWLFYVCETDRRGQKESIMDEYPREPHKERKRWSCPTFGFKYVCLNGSCTLASPPSPLPRILMRRGVSLYPLLQPDTEQSKRKALSPL